MEKIMVLLKNRKREIPLALAEVNSEFSPNLPIVIILLKSIASGRALGIRVEEVYQTKRSKFSVSIPLPIRSSMYTHKNCIMSTNQANKNVIINGPTYCFNIYQSNFLNLRKSTILFNLFSNSKDSLVTIVLIFPRPALLPDSLYTSSHLLERPILLHHLLLYGRNSRSFS